MKYKKNITNIILGIRFSKSFRIPDLSGEMIDNILYSKETPFSTDLFQQVESRGFERLLKSSDQYSYLRINTDDIILSINAIDDFDVKYNWLRNEVCDYFQKVLFPEFRIKRIQRIGIVYFHEFDEFENMDNIIKNVTDSRIHDANNIKLSFSKKLSVPEHLYKKGNKNYLNVINNLEQKENKFNISLDYQFYYEPMITDIRDCELQKIIDNSKDYVNKNFYIWVDKYVK